jgi:hypothetical protein
VDVENAVDASAVKLKPVIAAAAMGETPMSPVMTELGTVEMPDFERTAKPQAAPRSIGFPATDVLAKVAATKRTKWQVLKENESFMVW